MLQLHPHIPTLPSQHPLCLTFYIMARHPTTRQVHRTSRFNNQRRIGQQARRRRMAASTSTNHPIATVLPLPSHELPSVAARVRPSPLPLACRPLTPLGPSLRHTLQPFSEVICSSCGALHWIEERACNTSKMDLQFSTCCKKGSISLPPSIYPPEPLYSLLHDTTPSNS